MTSEEPSQVPPSISAALPSRRVRTALGLVLFFGLVGILLAFIGHHRSAEHSAARDIDRLQRLRTELQSLAERLDDASAGADRAEKDILSVLKECRTAEDIPHLGKHRIVSQHRGIDDFLFYVPAGTHTLEITCTWGPPEAPFANGIDPAPADATPPDAAPRGEKNWRVQLLPESGYHLSMQSNREMQPIEWHLTSSHSAFPTHSEHFPLDGFERRGWSYSATGIVAFPNQYQAHPTLNVQEVIRSRPGVKLWDVKLYGSYQERPCQVIFSARLRSDSPVHASADSVQRFLAWHRNEVRLQYRGGGKYELRPADSAPDATGRLKSPQE